MWTVFQHVQHMDVYYLKNFETERDKYRKTLTEDDGDGQPPLFWWPGVWICCGCVFSFTATTDQEKKKKESNKVSIRNVVR